MLTVLAIANTLDLPERLLTQRVASRMVRSFACKAASDLRVGHVTHNV
jgi:hypothetical protein